MAIRIPTLSIGLACLAGCAVFQPEARPQSDAPSDAPAPLTQTRAPPPGATTVDEFDTTSASDRRQALQGDGATGRKLGKTIASLGDVAQPGIWIKTPLVREAGRGRVVDPGTGTVVTLDLLPLDGAPGSGSRLSLAAMRLIGSSLTDLPELEVYALSQ
ncbi:MAG: hypothetical protein AAF678_12185 [Pseudomonadota bacterium]